MRAHLICGGTMVVTGMLGFDHDISFCRRKILDLFEDNASAPIWATCTNDYSELDRWLEPARLLVTYCAAPFANDKQTEQLQKWLEKGGRWIALHGSSGGIARKVPDSKVGQRKFVKQKFHDTLGAFFMNHPPIHEFKVANMDPAHPVMAGISADGFAIEDELYMIQLQGDMGDYKTLMTTDYVYDGKLPDGKSFDVETYAFAHDFDPSPDRRTRVLCYERKVGKGAVIYFGCGHTGTATKAMPNGHHSVWENQSFATFLKNAIAWGVTADA